MKLQPWRGKAAHDNWRRRIGKNILTPEQVREIRDAVGSDGEVASRFGISACTVHDVRRGRTYRWVNDKE